MRRAGIREARQNLTSLLDDVKKGREVVIADRGRPVAMLVPLQGRRPFPDLIGIRRRISASSMSDSQPGLDALSGVGEPNDPSPRGRPSRPLLPS